MILFAYLCKLPNSRKTFEYIITYKSNYILQYFYISSPLNSFVYSTFFPLLQYTGVFYTMSRFLAGGASSSNGEKYEVAKGSRKDVDYGSIANLINNEVS